MNRCYDIVEPTSDVESTMSDADSTLSIYRGVNLTKSLGTLIPNTKEEWVKCVARARVGVTRWEGIINRGIYPLWGMELLICGTYWFEPARKVGRLGLT